MEWKKLISRLLWGSVLVQGMAALLLVLLVLFQGNIKQVFCPDAEACAMFTLPYTMLVNVLYRLTFQALFTWGALRSLGENGAKTSWEVAGIILAALPAFFQWAVDSVVLNLCAAQSMAAVNSYQALLNAGEFFLEPIQFLGQVVFFVGMGMSIGWKWHSRGSGAPVSRLKR